MNKSRFVIVGIAVLVGVVYYFGFYTYFIKTEIHEELPMPAASAPDSPAPQMRTIAFGSFGEIDFVHKGSGQAKLIEIDGKTILRLENFTVTSGPDLYVYLSNSTKPTHEIKDLGNYINLGRLKATSGEQNYEIPQSAEGYRTAVIWCKQFGVLFSFAVME
ncbi:MAG: DM13 domain-containing protein [Candidatus Yanofskybacteria bacterium]|nr:DM13 domain-containing protein [Candidatus Yanofskybacteria bacterium]